jgi:cytoskeletal protein RodZ
MIGRRNKPSASQDNTGANMVASDVSLGDLLRGQRATLGKSLFDVQRELRIKAIYIAAIENCDVSAFETPSFIAGYVRSYARFLGLDGDEVFAHFCAESNFSLVNSLSNLSTSVRINKLISASQAPDTLKNSRTHFLPQNDGWLSSFQPSAIGSFLVLIGLISAIGYGGWAVVLEVQRVQLAPVDQVPRITSQTAPELLMPQSESEKIFLGQNRLRGAVHNSSSGDDALNRLYRPQALDFPVLVARDGPIGNIVYESVQDAKFIDANESIEATKQVVSVDEPADVQVVDAVLNKVNIFAQNPAWVRVSSKDGLILFEKILDAGESYAVPQLEQAPMLRAGNATSVYFMTDGAVFGPLSKSQNVVRDISLSAQSIKSSFDMAESIALPLPDKRVATIEIIEAPTILDSAQ